MEKLFVIYLGGGHTQSFIELHDMRFVVAKTIEDTYDELKKSWWGKPESLHLDAWGTLHWADGHEVVIKDVPASNEENKLYFVNLGGYDSKQFTELHKNIFVIAENDADAKVKALQQNSDWETPHRDYQFEVEKVVSINDVIAGKHFVHLIPNLKETPFEFTCKYVPIGKM
jgi:hypothetical protein